MQQTATKLNISCHHHKICITGHFSTKKITTPYIICLVPTVTKFLKLLTNNSRQTKRSHHSCECTVRRCHSKTW